MVDQVQIWFLLPIRETPLHRAARWGHVGAVEYIIQAGADVNIKDDDGVSE